MELLPSIEEIERGLKETYEGFPPMKWYNLKVGKCPKCECILKRKGKVLLCDSKASCYFTITIKKFERYMRKGSF